MKIKMVKENLVLIASNEFEQRYLESIGYKVELENKQESKQEIVVESKQENKNQKRRGK